VSAVCGLGAAVLVSAFALPARAVTVHPVLRGETRIVPVAARDQGGRKQHVVKRGESLTLIARQAGLSSWRPIYDLNRSISLPDLVYPGQKLALPAKGEKVKHRPLPATLRLATLQRSGAGTGGASGNAPDRCSVGGCGRRHGLGPARAVRVGWQLGHQHRQRLLRRPPVHARDLAGERRHRLAAERQPRRADPRRTARAGVAGLGRLPVLLRKAPPAMTA